MNNIIRTSAPNWSRQDAYTNAAAERIRKREYGEHAADQAAFNALEDVTLVVDSMRDMLNRMGRNL